VGLASFSQSDTTDQLSDDGRKNGFWTQYLDSCLGATNSANAYFYGYEFWDDGEPVFRFFGKFFWKKDALVYDGTFPTKGQAVLLDGVFTWYDAEDRVTNKEIYSAGQPRILKSSSIGSKGLSTFYEVLDFRKQYTNVEGTYFYQEIFVNHELKTTKTTQFWFRKGKKGWRSYKIKEAK
jgi:hypothetical protein